MLRSNHRGRRGEAARQEVRRDSRGEVRGMGESVKQGGKDGYSDVDVRQGKYSLLKNIWQ